MYVYDDSEINQTGCDNKIHVPGTENRSTLDEELQGLNALNSLRTFYEKQQEELYARKSLQIRKYLPWLEGAPFM